VDLIREVLDNIRDLEPLLPLLDLGHILVLAGQHGIWDRNARRVSSRDHGRVAGGSGFEDSALLGGQVHNLEAGQRQVSKIRSIDPFGPSIHLVASDNRQGPGVLDPRHETSAHLPAPAEAHNAPLLELALLGRNLLHDLRDARQRLRRRGLGLEELAQVLALLVVVRRVPADVGRLALEEVWHEDAVWVLLVAVGEDVGALDGLREEAEDVVDYEDCARGGGGAGGVCRVGGLSSCLARRNEYGEVVEWVFGWGW